MKKILTSFLMITLSLSSFAQTATDVIKESQGFSMNSLMRGILGMVVLVGIAILLSSDRKKINWKTVEGGNQGRTSREERKKERKKER